MTRQQTLSGIWAGAISAIICYAEYLGMGAVLGTALVGYGAQNKAVGTLLVVLSASIACFVLAFAKKRYLAGPRGASLALLVAGLLWLKDKYPGPAAEQITLLVALMLGCTTMVFLSSGRKVQDWFEKLPAWLLPGFIYASAIGIFAGAVKQYLASCLLISEWQAWGIFAVGSLVGILWPAICKAVAGASTSVAVKTVCGNLQSLSLLVAAFLAWGLYELSALSAVQGQYCARLGGVDIDLAVLSERASTLMSPAYWASGASLICAFLVGVAVGGAVAMESLTAAKSLSLEKGSSESTGGTTATLQTTAVANTFISVATLPASAISQSRTQTLWMLGQPSFFGVFSHAVALLVIALVANDAIAGLPQITLAVLMSLIAVQMIGSALTQTWSQAYDPETPVTKGLRAGLGLWLVIGITVVTGQVLWAFILPAVAVSVSRLYRHSCLKKRKKR